MNDTAAALAGRLQQRALDIGFDAAGIAAVTPLEAVAHYEAWLAAERHGAMSWLATERHRRRRADPALVLPGLRSILCVALCYSPGADPIRDARLGRISRYAAGGDYHAVMDDLLGRLEDAVAAEIPGARALGYSDTGAILERGWAERAGIGWIAKNTCVISPALGSWFVLGEVLIDRELAPDPPFAKHHCGTCSRCIDACPTGAIVAPQQLDARRCISYLTIELRGPIPRELRPLVGDWIFGCDICQEVCPWNRFAPPAREARMHARALEGWTLERFLDLDDAGFERLFASSPIRRTKRAGFLRNVCVALGNRREVAATPALRATLAHEPEPLVRGHAAWALGEIVGEATLSAPERDQIRVALRHAASADTDLWVRGEAAAC